MIVEQGIDLSSGAMLRSLRFEIRANAKTPYFTGVFAIETLETKAIRLKRIFLQIVLF